MRANDREPCNETPSADKLKTFLDGKPHRVPVVIVTQYADSKECQEHWADARVEHPVVAGLQMSPNFGGSNEN